MGQESQPASTGSLVKAGTIQGSAVAEELRTVLDAAGIKASLEADVESPQGVGLGLLGNINILVPPDKVEETRQIMQNFSQESEAPVEHEGGDRP